MKSVITLLLLLFSSLCIAQKKLTLYKTFGGVVYEMDTLTLSSKQVMMVLKPNAEAVAEFKVARRKSLIGSILGFSGGILLALPLVTAIAGGEPEWYYAGIGGGLFLASIPFQASSRGHALNAFDIYNNGLEKRTSRLQPALYLSPTEVKFVFRFR